MNQKELRELYFQLNPQAMNELLELRRLIKTNPDFKAHYKALKQHIVLDYGIRSMNPIINRKTDKHQYKEYIRATITHANTY